MTTTSPTLMAHGRGAVIDAPPAGDIKGAFGTISTEDTGSRRSMSAKLKTLLAIVGPGLIVMVGDNDAGAFSTYGQAGQSYGTKLLWTFLLLVPVLYVNQEMVLRLGAVTGVGYAKLIIERFGRFWGAFSVINLFLLNALTLVTEFIGVTLAASYLGVPKIVAVILAGGVIVLAASTGSLRRFERMAMIFCIGSLLLVPLYLVAHPPVGQMASGFAIPSIPGGSGNVSTVLLLIIGIVGTTIAPWQLFFQQSYVIDKRITPRFMRYEKADLWIGIVIVVVGGAALMGTTAVAFAAVHHGQFTDAAGLAAGIAAYAGHAAGALFAVALLDASMIGAFAVSLSTAYAIGDVLGLKHSLHRGVKQAKGFYAMYAALIALAAVVVLIPGSPLGLFTVGVQVLAGVLLPSATVFLLMLCNDSEVLGPWVNGRATNIGACIVIGALVVLSMILMAAVLFGSVSSVQVMAILAAAVAVGVVAATVIGVRGWRRRQLGLAPAVHPGKLMDRKTKENWRMPPLAMLAPVKMSAGRRIAMLAMWAYIALAFVLVIVRVIQLAVGH
ncbi:MAG TPA: NRAMP family divalent metal transporter [Streptosporangiaceae bacterium]|jgi:NRAMP (natural resistance-associated macrophage protein)-like metal ion transporter|nr:NRAMP family divalent metal transporter [Streptosporangiaceae bacterium]